MGRELRKVPAEWQHPKDENGNYIPLLGRSFSEDLAEWHQEELMWAKGFRKGFKMLGEKEWIKKEPKHKNISFVDWKGEKPQKEWYMPQWKEKSKTCMQLYQTTSEGIPITPVFKLTEFDELCKYAAKNCYIFADYRLTEKQWKKALLDDYEQLTNTNT